jgi:asparagine synthase (glutamine-hydrolysing)
LEREQGCRFRSTCDTEIIAPAYRYWGPAAFGRLRGMFAIGLWDADRTELVLARDPVGIKPLYFSVADRSVRFASELKALVALDEQSRELDVEALHTYLGQGYPGPGRSLISGIRPLPPGSYLVANRHGCRIERYWRPRRSGEITRMDDALAEFEPLWRQVVGDHLLSDVPVGLLLSGGVDSSLIAAALRDAPLPVSSYTAAFSIADYDETAAASGVARSCGLPHGAVTADLADPVSRFRSIVHHYDGQCADSSGLAFHAVCEVAARGHKVVLTGDGADEFFGGYETYRATRVAAVAGRLVPRGLARVSADFLDRVGATDSHRIRRPEKLARWLSGIAEAADCPHPQWRRYAFPRHLALLYTRRMREAVVGRDAFGEYADAVRQGSGSLVDRCLLADQSYYLPGDLLMKADAMSMAHGIEVRVPFLDRRIMEFAGRVHASLLTPLMGPDKYVLRRQASRSRIPQRVAMSDKRGFSVPVANLLRTTLKTLGDSLLLRDPDVFAPDLDPDGVRQLWSGHQDGSANHGYVLWSLLSLAMWRADRVRPATSLNAA